MNKMRTSRLLTLTALAVLGSAFSSSIIWAQTFPSDTYKVNYFSNANFAGAPDGTVQIINPGKTGGSICALIYVFNLSEEMQECCACTIKAHGLLTLSINTNLTSNQLTGGVLAGAGVIHVISSSTCDAAKPNPVSGGVRAWGTHIQMPAGATAYAITETDFQDATLSSVDETLLAFGCAAIELDTGGGTCSCGNGG